MKKGQSVINTVNHIDYECMQIYDDIFGTTRGFYFLEPAGLLAHDPASNKDYFCLYEDKDTFLNRCQRSLECGENLFTVEWREWEGYMEGKMY